MSIKDFIFGKEKVVADSKLGSFKARIKNAHPSISHTWTSVITLPEKSEETVIILEGNSDGPFRGQLNSAYKIVDSLNEIAHQLLKRIQIDEH